MGGARLVRRISGNHEQDTFDTELVRGLASHCDMRAMNRIERAAEDGSLQ